jgi:hypothetical protein
LEAGIEDDEDLKEDDGLQTELGSEEKHALEEQETHKE